MPRICTATRLYRGHMELIEQWESAAFFTEFSWVYYDGKVINLQG